MTVVLLIHYAIGICSIVFNLAVIIIVGKRTPKQYKINAYLIFEECVFLLISSISNLVSMQRLIPIPDTTIFGSLGVCTQVSTHFCYYFHVLTVGAFACSFFMASYQLLYRQRLLNGIAFNHVIWWCFPTAFCVLGIHINASVHQSDTIELEKLVNGSFPEFIEERIAINGHDSFINSIPVLLVNGFYVTLLNMINSQTCKLSEKSKKLQRKLVQMVTVHAALSTTALWPSFIFFFGQFIAVHDPDFLDSCFFFIQLHCAIAPVVIVYHVPNYRRTILSLAGISYTSREEMTTVMDVARRTDLV